MQILLFYMLKVALCSALLYGYYLAVLKDRQFHHYNRFYLLAVFLVSWIIPLVTIELKPFQGASTPVSYQLAEVIADNNSSFEGMIVEDQSYFNWHWILPLFLGMVSFVVLTGVLRSLISILFLIRRNPVNRLKELNLVMTDAKGTPYSFFSYIFWNRNLDLESRIGQQMLAHELVHFRQKHSIDKLLIELMMVVGWFNPVFWILKRELYLIHEFIADSRSIENNDSALLAELLFAATYPQHQNKFTHPFFFSPIKRRITMLKKNALPRFSYFRRILVIPIVSALFLVFAFRNTNSNLLLNLDKQYVVVLDAGHGGSDPGAKSSTGITEAEMALAMAKRIVALNKNSNIRFELSREKDEFIRVNDRATYAVEKKADLFVSIHMNASPNNQRSGLEIFCPQQSSLGFLRSLHLAGVLKLTLDSEFKSSAVKTRKDKIWILDHSTVPAVIVLPGYITNPKDFSHMQSRQEEIASKILMGIENYLTEKERGYIKVPIEAEWEQALPKKQEPQKVKFTPPLIISDTVKFTPAVIVSDTVIFAPPVIIKNKVEIVFNASMTLAVLEKIKAGLKKEKIDLDFEKLEFNPFDGKLSFIKFHVDCHDGFKGSAEYPISNNKKIGFYRDYSQNVESPFGVGIVG